MRAEYFLDTNILLYRYSDQDDEKCRIAANLLESGNAMASAQVLNEFCNVVRKKFPAAYTSIESTLIDIQRGCTLSVPLDSGLRTTAQMVSRHAAEQLLARSAPFDRPVDTFVQSHWHTGIRAGAIHPSGISEIADQMAGSTIQTGQKTLWEKLRRELARARYRRAVQRHARHSPAPHALPGEDAQGPVT